MSPGPIILLYNNAETRELEKFNAFKYRLELLTDTAEASREEYIGSDALYYTPVVEKHTKLWFSDERLAVFMTRSAKFLDASQKTESVKSLFL